MKEKTFHLTRLTDKKLSNVRSAKESYFYRIIRKLPSPFLPGKNIDENENETEKDTENLTISVDAKSVIEVNTATDDSKEKNHRNTKL